MAYTKYSLTPANNNAAPPNGAPEGMLPSAVNDTMRDMMAQIRDAGDGIRNGTYTMTAPVITGGSITGVALSGNTFTNPVITGGSITGITDLAIADGGTGASTAANARTNLGLGTAATTSATDYATAAQGTKADSALQPAAIGTTVQAYSPVLSSYATNGVSFKNRIINGDMRIDQRNAGASVTPANGDYTLDRWRVSMSVSSKFSVQQNAGSVATPVGFKNYMGATSLSAYSVTGSELFGLQQRIEGYNFSDLEWGTANAKTVTISFWVRSSLTGTFGGSFSNSASDRFYPFSYTISSANTWEYKTVTIAGDTTGTWVWATNGVGVRLFFSLGVGSTRSGTAGSWTSSEFYTATGATSVVGTNGATFYITGVQLEVGSSATPFDTRAYGTELALCQRYYEKTYNATVVPATSTNNGAQIANITCDGSGGAFIGYSFKVSKCTTPTITAYTTGGTAGSWGYSRSGASGNGAVTTGFLGQNGFYLSTATGGAWVAVQVNGHWVASAEL